MCCATCAFLLARIWLHLRERLFAFLASAFVLLTISNLLLFVDLTVTPKIDLLFWRYATTIAGIVVLLAGLVRRTQP